jgi:1-acyl-sn-glycerol-3-phosphate acyltransferase
VERTVAGIARRLLHTLGVRVTASGTLPADGALVAANHLGWLDVLACSAAWPALRFVAKREVAGWPFIGAVVRAHGTVLIDRTRKRDLLRSIPRLADTLAAGTAVCVFAEGTTSDGRTVLPFKSSLFDAAVRAGRPVVPLAIDALVPADGPPAETHVCWWGATTLLAHLPRVAGLRACTVRLRLGAPLGAAAMDDASATAAATIPVIPDAESPRSGRPATRRRRRKTVAAAAHAAVCRLRFTGGARVGAVRSRPVADAVFTDSAAA